MPVVQAVKKVRIIARLGRLPAHVRFVPIDFDRQPLDAALRQGGLDRQAPAVFRWEGVTQYLEPGPWTPCREPSQPGRRGRS